MLTFGFVVHYCDYILLWPSVPPCQMRLYHNCKKHKRRAQTFCALPFFSSEEEGGGMFPEKHVSHPIGFGPKMSTSRLAEAFLIHAYWFFTVWVYICLSCWNKSVSGNAQGVCTLLCVFCSLLEIPQSGEGFTLKRHCVLKHCESENPWV